MTESSSFRADFERLIAAERKRPAPPAQAKTAVAASLAAALGEDLAAPGVAKVSTKTVRIPGWARMAPTLGAAFLLGTGLGMWLGARRTVVPARNTAESPQAVVRAAPGPVAAGPALAAPSAVPALARSSSAMAINSSRATALDLSQNTADTRLAAERVLVDTARSALARGDAPAALEALGRHEKQFWGGQLSEERSALLVQALASLGRGREAGERAGQFRLRYPRSLLLPVVDQAVGARQ